MRFLLDTHAFLWLLDDDPRLHATARQHMLDGEVWVSIVSLWELAIKVRIGKLQANLPELERAMTTTGLRPLALETAHVLALRRLPRVSNHGDPFDHALLAQAVAEGFVFVSDDRWVANYPVSTMTCAGAVRRAD